MIEKAFREDQDSMFFGLFCSLALELLARAAVANIHPTLLAETDSKQKNLLYALGKDDSISPKSIAMTKVVDLCAELIPAFTDDLKKLTLAMTERRNEELHSGGAAFEEYNQDKWIGEFYAYYQWYYNIPSEEVIRKVPLVFLKRAYPGLSDLDLESAVQKVGLQ